MLISLCVLLVGCDNSLTTNTTTITTTEQPTTTNATISNHLELGLNFNNMSDERLVDLHAKYDFDGDVYFLFGLDFPDDVSITYGTSGYFDYLSMDEATIESSGFGDQSLFEYIISELEEFCTETTINDPVDGIVYYMDNDGNVLKMMSVSETEVYLRISRHFTNYDDSFEFIDMYFIYTLGLVDKSIEASRTKVVDGCPSCVVSEVIDGEYTYTFMGYTFKISENGAILIDGYYHFDIMHVEDE